jgi:DNA-binding transcriptional regulator of glucitol operon
VGSARSRWGARFYAILVADPNGRILVAEHLAGMTVFARLEPVQGFVGLTVEELLRESERVGREDRLGRLSLAAFRDAGERFLAAVRCGAAAPATDEDPAR